MSTHLDPMSRALDTSSELSHRQEGLAKQRWLRTLAVMITTFGIALALIPLLILTGDRTLMGEHRNHPLTQAIGRVIVALVIGLNAYLLVTMI